MFLNLTDAKNLNGSKLWHLYIWIVDTVKISKTAEMGQTKIIILKGERHLMLLLMQVIFSKISQNSYLKKTDALNRQCDTSLHLDAMYSLTLTITQHWMQDASNRERLTGNPGGPGGPSGPEEPLIPYSLKSRWSESRTSYDLYMKMLVSRNSNNCVRWWVWCSL